MSSGRNNTRPSQTSGGDLTDRTNHLFAAANPHIRPSTIANNPGLVMGIQRCEAKRMDAMVRQDQEIMAAQGRVVLARLGGTPLEIEQAVSAANNSIWVATSNCVRETRRQDEEEATLRRILGN